VYIHKLSRKLTTYIRHCPQCQLNQTRRHREYGDLMPLSTPFMPFHTVAIDFVLAFPKTNPQQYDCVLNVTDNISRRVLSIAGRFTFNAAEWANKVPVRLQSADWGIPASIISDRTLSSYLTSGPRCCKELRCACSSARRLKTAGCSLSNIRQS